MDYNKNTMDKVKIFCILLSILLIVSIGINIWLFLRENGKEKFSNILKYPWTVFGNDFTYLTITMNSGNYFLDSGSVYTLVPGSDAQQIASYPYTGASASIVGTKNMVLFNQKVKVGLYNPNSSVASVWNYNSIIGLAPFSTKRARNNNIPGADNFPLQLGNSLPVQLSMKYLLFDFKISQFSMGKTPLTKDGDKFPCVSYSEPIMQELGYGYVMKAKNVIVNNVNTDIQYILIDTGTSPLGFGYNTTVSSLLESSITDAADLRPFISGDVPNGSLNFSVGEKEYSASGEIAVSPSDNLLILGVSFFTQNNYNLQFELDPEKAEPVSITII